MAAYYYRILGVDPGASQDEIRRAYRRLVKEYHPDLNSSEGAVERFHLIQKAWETLGDPEERAFYDGYVKRYTHRPGDVTATRGPGAPYRYSTHGRNPYHYRGPFNAPPTATPEEEARSYTKEWFLIGFIFVLMVAVPLTGPVWAPMLLNSWHKETWAKILWAEDIITYEYRLKDDEPMSGDVYDNLTYVAGELLSPEGMPVIRGDSFHLIYMPMASHVHTINFNRPAPPTLERYYGMIWLRLQESALLDHLADGAMKGVFLYSLSEAMYDAYGVKGLAALYFALTPPNINPVHNNVTFLMLSRKPEFIQMVTEIRKVTMPLI